MVSKKERQKREIRKAIYSELSGFVLDVIKLVFGGVILAGIMGMTSDKLTLIVVGIFVIGILFVLWYLLFYNSKIKE